MADSMGRRLSPPWPGRGDVAGTRRESEAVVMDGSETNVPLMLVLGVSSLERGGGGKRNEEFCCCWLF